MLKKCISLFLVLVMVVSVFTVIPFSASAEEVPDTAAALTNDDLTVTGTNSLGTMLAQEYEENAANTEDTGCGIYAVEVEGKTARVDVRTLTDAQLVVSIYDEDGKTMYGSGMADVTKDDSIVELSLEINSMPQYFYIKAFLLDKYTNLPLCKQFENNYYTQEMQEFFAKTTDDFDEDKVLNLDNSEQENFLVYNDDTIIIDNDDENTNIVTKADDDSKEYVIENIDEKIAALQAGDIFSYDFGDSNLLIIKIASITINGTTAIIQGDEIELQDAFGYIKIDTVTYTDESNYDGSNLGDGVEYIGETAPNNDIVPTGADIAEEASTGITVVDWDVEHSHELNFKFGEKKAVEEYYNSETTEHYELKKKMYGEFGVKLGVNFKCYYDEWAFGRNIELSVVLKYEFSVSLKAKLSESKATSLGIGYIFYEPVPGVTISLTPSVLVSGKLKASFKLVYKGQVGFRYKDGYNEDLSNSPKPDFEIDFEGELFIGLSLEPQINVLGDIAKAKAEAIAGLRIKGKTHHSTAGGFDDQPSEKHTCTVCIEGDISLVLELNVELSLFNNPDLTWKADLVKAEWKLTDFYWSLDHAEFGFGTCPYRQYKCTITLVDPEKKPLSDVMVNEVKTDSNGKAVMYLQRGINDLTIKKGEKSIKRSYFVTGAGKPTFTIDFDKPDGRVGSGSGGSVVQTYRKVAQSGQCGNNVFYKLYRDGELYIYGTGDMYDYMYASYGGQAPWMKYTYYRNITTVTIDNGVTSIGRDAFNGCSGVLHISIPESVARIGRQAFDGCSSLESVFIPEKVSDIGILAFSNCTSIRSISVDENNPVYCSIDGSLYSKDMKRLIRFANDNSIVDFVVPYGVETIDDGACNKCNNLINVIIPDSVTGKVSLNAFRDCQALESVVIGNGVTGIGRFAFCGCTSLTNVAIGNSVTFIDELAFGDCFSLNSVRIPASVTYIWESAFFNCKSLQSIEVDEKNERYFSVEGNLYDHKSDKTRADLLQYSIGKTDKEFRIPDGVVMIRADAFACCENLKNVIISEGVQQISSSAFSNCTSLEEIMLPNGITSIGSYAFNNCTSLAKISIPASLKKISSKSFMGCTNLNAVYLADVSSWCSVELEDSDSNPIKYAHNIYVNDTLVKHLVIPAGVTIINERSFIRCTCLSDITFSDTVTKISDYAFANCSGLTGITLPVSVITIGNGAFENCTSFSDIYYMGSETEFNSINIGAFNIPYNSANLHFIGEDDAASTGVRFDAFKVKNNHLATETINLTDTGSACVGQEVKDIVPIGEDDTSMIENELGGFSRKHLLPGTEAVLIILEGTEDTAELTAASLLYIAQGTVDENGSVSFDVQQDFGDISWVAYIFGECDHSSSTWTTSKKAAAGEEGLKVLICDYCGAVLDSEVIEALPAAYILGDADGNGGLESVDATFIQRCIAQIPTPYTKAELMRGDVDSSGDLELTDVTAIQYYLCHLKTPYPIGETVS